MDVGWLVPIVLVVALADAWRRFRRRQDRQRRLMLLCDAAGLELAPVDPFPDTTWLPFETFGHARSRSENVVWDPRHEGVRVFDYWFEDATQERPVGGGTSLTCAAITVPFSCSRLRVAPHGLGDELGEALGLHEVRLELEAFNRRFAVRATDPRFAVAFLDPRMMEALLRLPEDGRVDLYDQVLLLWAPLLPAERVLLLLVAALAVHGSVPRVMSSLFPPRPPRGPHEARWLQGGWSAEATGSDREA